MHSNQLVYSDQYELPESIMKLPMIQCDQSSMDIKEEDMAQYSSMEE
jgi:hypothetical protein